VAAALVRPERAQGMKVRALKKKLKETGLRSRG